MSNFYYKIDGHTLRLTNNEGIPAEKDEEGYWPWEDCGGIPKVIIDGPIQLPPDSPHLFAGIHRLITIEGLDNLDTSQVTDMSHMFEGCDSLTTIDLSGFDTNNVVDMSDMFYDCASLQSVTTADQRIIAELPDGVSVEAPTAQEPTMADEASRAVSIEGEPSEPKPQTR